MARLPFADRLEAGRLLASELSLRTVTHDAVVVALTRGGVPVGFAVADRLRLPLDVIVVRKIGVPWQPELAMGAVAGQASVLDEQMIKELGIPREDVDEIVARELTEMRRREELYRGGAPVLDLHDRLVILVDDGLATGSTMLAAIRHVRAMDPKRIIVAVPVASDKACQRLRGEADDVVCPAIPEYFFAVGEWYRDFSQVSDSEVQHLLAESRRRLSKYLASPTAA